MNIRYKKILNAIIFFASKSPHGTINRLKLMKLLWLADRLHLNKFGRLILKDNYNALPHGPVPTDTMDTSKKTIAYAFEVDDFEIKNTGNFDDKYFSKSDIEIMTLVWEKYGTYDPFKLRDLSHKFPEWLRYEKELNNKSLPNSYSIIIDDFFCLPIKNTDYDYNKKESEVSKVNYHKHQTILSNLSGNG